MLTQAQTVTPCWQLGLGDFIVKSDGNYTMLLDLIIDAGLEDALNGTSFTMFAPTNDAFMSTLEKLNITANELMADNVLANLLRYHVSLTPRNLTNLTGPTNHLQSILGETFTIMTMSNVTMVKAGNDTASVVTRPINGYAPYQNERCQVYIYPVESVLLPAGALDSPMNLLNLPILKPGMAHAPQAAMPAPYVTTAAPMTAPMAAGAPPAVQISG
jgi:uncharacterized surface protein with fasciclin (FAS1) repeats